MTGAFVLITLGVLFLLNNLYPSDFRFGRMWPVILIVIGVVKIVEYFQRPAAAEVPGRPPSRPVPPPIQPPRAPVAPPPVGGGTPPVGSPTSQPRQLAPPKQSDGYEGDDILAAKPPEGRGERSE